MVAVTRKETNISFSCDYELIVFVCPQKENKSKGY